jgi:ABC-type antimicrobial peptide transport system permease subunit
LLALTGIYGVISYSIARRSREFGIRMALGARASQVLFMVLRQAATPVGFGIAAGVLLAALGSSLAAALLFGVSPGDPVTLIAVGTLLLLTGLMAAAIPAWRAARTDPAVVLRA